MKSTKVICCHIILIQLCIIYTSQEYIYETNYIDIPLDHFSFSNNKTFRLRYLVNDSYWNSDGPIFFYTGNEGDIREFARNTGFMWEIAPEFRALLVFAEHRYYGKSLPFGEQSYSELQHLGYLTSSQALADYVYLIDYIQTLNNDSINGKKNPVIAFGGSYGGMLSAWLRMKYPASVLGAISSSAPVWQFETPCETFNRIVTSIFKISTSRNCPTFIAKSWPALRQIVNTADGRKWLSSKWKFCKNLDVSEAELLFDWLQEIYSNLAMVNYPYPANFLANLPAYPVKAFCEKLPRTIPQDSKTLVELLGKALEIYTNYTKTTPCVNISQSNNDIGEKGWDFQACTEMIMPMCSTDDDMFENKLWNFTEFTEDCYKRWKIQMHDSRRVLMEYGGKDLRTASNIIFSNGLLDPWSGGGVLTNISKSVLAVLISDAAHHLDLRAHNPSDPYSVIQARRIHKRAVRNWLRSYYKEEFNMYYN